MTFLKADLKNGVLTWHFSRAERANAIGPTVAEELLNQLRELERALKSKTTSPPKCLVFRPEPLQTKARKICLAGGDLKELAHQTDASIFFQTMQELTNGISNLPIPTLAVIDGDCLGGGCELALSFDLCVATEDVNFEFKQMEIGLSYGFGIVKKLVHSIGYSRCLDLILLGKKLSAIEAMQMGLVSHVSNDRASLDLTTESYTARLTSLEPVATEMTKRNLKLYLPSKKDEELQNFLKTWMNPTHKNILDTFSKRK